MRFFKIAGAVLGVVVLLIAVAAAVVAGDRLVASLLESRGSVFLGREIRIGGAFHVDWGRVTRVTAEDVHVANAAWGSAPEMFGAGRIELEIRPWPLLRLQVVVPRLALDRPKLLLETSAEGRKNWDFFAAKSATPQKRQQFPDVHEIAVAEGVFAWHNGASLATTEFTFDQLAVKASDLTSPVAIAARGQFQHQPYALEASVGALRELQDVKRPYPVKLAGTLGQNRVSIEGSIAEPMDLEGLETSIVLDGKDLKDLFTALGIPHPETPSYRFAGKLTHQGDWWTIDGLDAVLGKSRLAGGIAVEVGGKLPYIKADLTSKYLDLADFKGFYGGEPEKKAQARPPEQRQQEKKAQDTGARVIPDKKLPVERLPGINADVSLDAIEVKPTAGLPFQRVIVGLRIKDGTLALKPLHFAIADGEVAADLVWAAGPRPPTFDANIDIRHLDLKKLFGRSDMPKMVQQLAGIIGGFVKLKSKGVSERAILANANGDIGLFMENGQISHLLIEVIHLNALNSLGWWVQGDKPLPVNCLVTRFDVKDGVATASTILLDTEAALIDGAGNINLGDETLFLDLRPYHKTPVVVTFRTPIEIRGTFAKPLVTPNPTGIGERLAAAIGIGVLAPPAALLPLISTGLGEKNACGDAYAAQVPPQQPTQSGSSKTPTKAPRSRR
jgi:uncharacterized protein involved in outer membrane biogenesis